MPTDENLIKRGCIVVSGCNLCLSSSETTTHLFLSCDFANQIWTWLGSLLQIVFNTNSFRELFDSFDTGWSPFFTLIANVAIIHALHVIWLARNDIRFNNAVISIHAAKIKILTAIKLSTATMTGRPKIEELSLLQQLAVMPRLASTTSAAVKMVLWCTPSIGWMKVNTDGSVTNASAACGGLFRDYLANFHGGYAQKISGLSVLHAELMALILAMEVAHSKTWHYLWLESDSLNALRAFDDMNVVPWDLRNRWSNCLNLGLTLKWSHIF
jgi:hypothetical protein